ncbi:tRNA methyltransferase subunit GCD14, putative [Talaromyces stipitatus ATCC 10500]|uniref:tRNA (adenine(58)-N(1))-methyltransferase catalytic subunit TRM61 n=1 Tax=Talaromyces stipitatus (strain ATCC 10500 / CBS 375.48 / QM 6759 / NRRL 1006) TaxID=441959 RepID=B8M9Q1_TALSN|nr:tRNA methyltransferase subunit GCD14, putative [Talaromyces stipitatus ATCC 10500]EED18053.1 tRNA methyltransferase subunit GCD14, putative [Talaromyces stipitatus ATCC 10500]
MPSPFFNPGTTSHADQLAILHLRRDALVPTILRTHDDENLGYDEGKVTNTRFGSFPHSTLIDQPWGSQIVASEVNTGRRSNKRGGKRKAAALNDGDDTATSTAATTASPKTASSGFIHLLPPTPESWTSALPHRTQVVYTPDYSYILHRLRASPGKTIIEAGAGSGSFTHAAARSVFNGYESLRPAHKKQKTRLGKVCSFEFHEARAGKVQEELVQHGLEDVVRVTHRDVYNDGFLLGDEPSERSSPKANAIFLDLPAPWLALKHLVRNPEDGSKSPLDPSSAVRICTFSPCMEQVQKTISVLRQYGWLSISMVEVMHKRIEVRREVVGLDNEGVRRAIVYPKSVEEAVGKLRVVENRLKEFKTIQREAATAAANGEAVVKVEESNDSSSQKQPPRNDQKMAQVPSYELGRLVHRSEPDIKTHTSYLVFAVLPRAWSEEDEQKARELYPSRPT